VNEDEEARRAEEARRDEEAQRAEARRSEEAWRAWSRQYDEAWRAWARQPRLEQEWIRQNNLIYGGLIGIGVVLVQPFLTATSLDFAAWICIVAFSIAIPLLAGLVLVSEQEAFERRASGSKLVTVAKGTAMGIAFIGIVAGFWHITWIAGVGMLVGGFLAMSVHSAGLRRLVEGPKTPPQPPAGAAPSESTDE
jgi:hypothetical protein